MKSLKEDRDREHGHFIIVICVIMLVLLYAMKASSCEIEDAIKWSTIEKDNIRIYGPAAMSVEYQQELAYAFKTAGEKYDIPPLLLVAMSYYETLYRNLIGDNGRSHGIMQVGIMGRKKCKCTMNTVLNQIMCGACWLNMGRNWCGNLHDGLNAYAAGTCKSKNMRTKRAVAIRLEMQNKMMKETAFVDKK